MNEGINQNDKIKQAELEIGAIFQEVAMQPLDVERSMFNDILNDLRSGKISPEEAVRKAHIILNTRQDYH